MTGGRSGHWGQSKDPRMGGQDARHLGEALVAPPGGCGVTAGLSSPGLRARTAQGEPASPPQEVLGLTRHLLPVTPGSPGRPGAPCPVHGGTGSSFQAPPSFGGSSSCPSLNRAPTPEALDTEWEPLLGLLEGPGRCLLRMNFQANVGVSGLGRPNSVRLQTRRVSRQHGATWGMEVSAGLGVVLAELRAVAGLSPVTPDAPRFPAAVPRAAAAIARLPAPQGQAERTLVGGCYSARAAGELPFGEEGSFFAALPPPGVGRAGGSYLGSMC